MDFNGINYGAETILERLGSPLHYWLKGRSDAPLVTFIHGAGVDHRIWAPQVDEFAREYRVLTLDLRGHGRSRPLCNYSFGTLVEDCFAVLDVVGAAKTILIGLSMGGNVAQEMVFRDPDRIAALVCVDCTCNTLVSRWVRMTLPAYALLFGPLLYAYPWLALLKSIGKQSCLAPDGQRYVIEACGQLTKKDTITVMKTLLAALHHEPGYRVPVPELLLHGASDKLGNIRKVMPEWHGRDTSSEFMVIPEASHVANVDNPGYFNRAVTGWLRRTVGGPRHAPSFRMLIDR